MPSNPVIGNVTRSSELVEMAMGFGASRVLCAAARLGIADALGDAQRSAQEVAAACSADAPSTYRLMRAMAALGVLQQPSPEHFRLTEMGLPLRKDAPDSAWPGVIFWADLLADSWSHLTDCVRTGHTAAQVMEDAGIASLWSRDPDASSIFRAVMGTSPIQNYAPIVDAWEFPASGVVADLGGGGGALIRAVLDSHSALRGWLVDREASIADAVVHFQDGALAARCELITADLCESVPQGANVHLLKHVLHGYTDEQAVAVLRNCRAALPPDGALLVIEFVLPDIVAQPEPQLAMRFMSDLNMMAVTGGRERSEAEWRRLLASAGFTLQRAIAVPEMEVSILEARPAASA